MTLDQFTRSVEPNNNVLARSLFERMSSDGTRKVSCKDFVTSMSLVRFGTDEDRLAFAFKLYDVDNSGSIEQADLVEILRVGFICFTNPLNGTDMKPRNWHYFVGINHRYIDMAIVLNHPSET